MIKNSLINTVISLLLMVSSHAFAAPKTMTLPPETAQLKKSIHPGYIIAQQKCSICHSADYINLQPPGMNLSQWTKEVTKMQHAYGAPLTNQDIQVISEYLATTYGNEKAAVTTKVKTKIAAPVKTANVMDVKTLLANNTCLSCHAIKQKVLGPSYHDVAERYRKNPKAIETVMANIKAGGVNKWGATPMPPFAGLSDAELKVLAKFVLSQ